MSTLPHRNHKLESIFLLGRDFFQMVKWSSTSIHYLLGRSRAPSTSYVFYPGFILAIPVLEVSLAWADESCVLKHSSPNIRLDA